MGVPARLVTRARAYGRERIPHSGGLVYAINHLHWIDVPLVGVVSPRNVDFVAKAEAVTSPSSGGSSAGTARSACAAASPTATPCG